MEVEFIAEDVDYSVAEFYEKFHANLPVVVQVNQGFQGHIIEDTFGKGEILYLAAISKQKRVVAHVQTKTKCRVLSFPEAFTENLCVDKHGKAGQESSLSEIVHHRRLPVHVQYPPNEIIITGQKSFSSNEIPHLKLVKTFEETYLLGNYLTDGKLGKDIVHIPLYLSQLRLCRIIGMKRLSQTGWASHCEALKDESRKVEYDLLFGNQYVAEYDTREIHPGTNYAYTEPLKYDEFINLIMHWHECSFGQSAFGRSSRTSAPDIKTDSGTKHDSKQCDDIDTERQNNTNDENRPESSHSKTDQAMETH